MKFASNDRKSVVHARRVLFLQHVSENSVPRG